ncbi:SDR family oxidoreductase [Streptomyces sp. SID8379]|uniref:SDR family NAD(P)-dependent oxidoreductase n=1 Tax=unclassified Streptomyces TaxID=2593676 RepID=UPI0003600060|nr:SDR family NAD(P)-dependent oxidoreductase [Streptomyces sp. HmicA12]MYW66157.1 SDR family oxidoreductase [Streptomyces sp. SID8379]
MNTPGPEGEFAGRTALVTGAATGLGLAVARRLAAGGAAVAVVDRDTESAAKAAAELTADGARAIALTVDVTDPVQVEAAVHTTVAAFGALHLAVNTAAVTPSTTRTADIELDDWRRVLSVHLDGVFHAMKYEIPALLASGTGGAVVNLTPAPDGRDLLGAAYSAARHAVIGLTRTAAVEYAAQGIRVNAVTPGSVDTPLRTSLAPEEAAELTAFLLSDRASFCNGGVYGADGAHTAP